MSERFDIFFSGQIMAGQDETAVRARLGRIFNATPEQLDRLFSGRPVKIKAGVDIEKAGRYRVSFRNAGALIEIKPAAATTATPAAAPRKPPPPAGARMELLPARTGSLIDCAPRVAPAVIPGAERLAFGDDSTPLDDRPPPPPARIDTSGLTLGPARPDTALDERPPPPPARIDTSGLTLGPANTGSLEDCQPPAEAVRIPDISALEIVAPKAKF